MMRIDLLRAGFADLNSRRLRSIECLRRNYFTVAIGIGINCVAHHSTLSGLPIKTHRIPDSDNRMTEDFTCYTFQFLALRLNLLPKINVPDDDSINKVVASSELHEPLKLSHFACV